MSVPKELFAGKLRDILPEVYYVHMDPLARYLELVAEYSDILNLTAHRETGRLSAELVGESLKLLKFGDFPEGCRVVDLGSGNGSPVVPLAIASPQAGFLAVESRNRRHTFLTRVKATLELNNLKVIDSRVEEVARAQEHSFNAVTSRAFAKPSELLPLALNLLENGGEVRGYCGSDCGEVREAASGQGLGTMDFISYEGPTSPRHIYRLAR